MSKAINKIQSTSLGTDIRYDILRQYLDIESLLPELGIKKAKRTSTEIIACCPFHNDKHPSWSINIDQDSDRWGLFHCFVCQSGNVISLVKNVFGITYVEALKYLEDFAGIQDVENLAFDATIDRRVREENKNTTDILSNIEISFPGVRSNNEAYDWLINTRKVKEYQISDRDIRLGTGQYSGKVIFPIKNQYGIVSFYARTYTNQKQRELYYTGKGTIKNSLYGYERSDYLVNWCYLVEGCIDSLSTEVVLKEMYNDGRYNNVFAVLGPILHGGQVELLKYWDNIVLIPDMKGNAESIVPTAKKLLQNKNLYIVECYKGEDPDSMANKYRDQFKGLLSRPIPVYETKVQYLVDYGD